MAQVSDNSIVTTKICLGIRIALLPNYARAFFFTHAIPFQDTEIRMRYDWTDTFYTEFYPPVLQAWV